MWACTCPRAEWTRASCRTTTAARPSSACASPGWPAYDALGDPATGLFTIMPGCLVGAYGQMLLRTYWEKLRARLCASRGIPREAYWQHLAVFDLLERQGALRLRDHLLGKLEKAG
ncbi:hypothetical protein [Fundidesulfovibrio terrae]|uniref:hypothetical protein n=1 Tax=Fundidesulfovibrio terrae TaxID=2922866 RepID=UPI001FAE9E97|nr:hypothetical protein [Fundidesulfovibrio terrae]